MQLVQINRGIDAEMRALASEVVKRDQGVATTMGSAFEVAWVTGVITPTGVCAEVTPLRCAQVTIRPPNTTGQDVIRYLENVKVTWVNVDLLGQKVVEILQ
jgi:hypothetical protein